MVNSPADDEEYADDIFGASDYEAPKPKKKEFLPWHKPRKQYVRRYQWCEQIKKLFAPVPTDDVASTGETTLRYFGLPGIDLLDLRYFHDQVCEPSQLRMRFLGFNKGANPESPAQTELNISLLDVISIPLFDPL
jgi:hypothetical protein